MSNSNIMEATFFGPADTFSVGLLNHDPNHAFQVLKQQKFAPHTATDGSYDFEIVNMKSLQDWIVYMLTIPSWLFLAKNIQNTR